MKKQLQKIFFLLFLTGCMTAPQHCFEDNLKSENSNIRKTFHQISFISERAKFDSVHHIENRLPQSPEQAIQSWIQKNLAEVNNLTSSLQIVLHQAEIIRKNLPSEHWWQPDYIKDTLNYNIEVIQNNNIPTLHRHFNVAGKTYVQMGRRTSLAEKEKQWANLYRTMLDHLGKEIIKLPHETEPHKN